MRTRSVYRAAVAAMGVASLAVAACGDESTDVGGGEGGGGLEEAASRTLEAETMAFELELSVDAFGETRAARSPDGATSPPPPAR